MRARPVPAAPSATAGKLPAAHKISRLPRMGAPGWWGLGGKYPSIGLFFVAVGFGAVAEASRWRRKLPGRGNKHEMARKLAPRGPPRQPPGGSGDARKFFQEVLHCIGDREHLQRIGPKRFQFSMEPKADRKGTTTPPMGRHHVNKLHDVGVDADKAKQVFG